MDQLKYDAFCQSLQDSQNPTQINAPTRPSTAARPIQQPNLSKSAPVDVNDPVAARKLQKADREKSRRDRLNVQFAELGNVLDPERPKNDKATILCDTIQLLKDLTAQVSKLKAEHDALSEESIELTQEKNDLREEKASIKSDIERLNAQYQQRLEAKYPWPAMDHSVMMAPPSYPFPMPMAIPPGQFSMHPSMQLYPFYGNQIPAVYPDPCSSFVPYLTPNNLVDQQSSQYVSPVQTSRKSLVSDKQNSDNDSSGESKHDKSEGNNDVGIDLELKTPGSRANQDISSGRRKRSKFSKTNNNVTEGSFSSGYSSPRSIQDSSSNSIVGKTIPTTEKARQKN